MNIDPNITISPLCISFDGVLMTQFMAVVTVGDIMNGRLVGTVQLQHHGMYVARLRQLFIDPNFRRRGIATRLLDNCQAAARLSCCKAITLHVRRDNEVALALYEKDGYEIVDEEPPDFILAKQLK